MENYTSSCRFILSCNYSSKIIDPIQSRCTVFKFKPLEKEELLKIVDMVIKEEGLTVNDEAKETLFEACHGDARRAANILQSAATFNKTITSEDIFSIASLARPKELNVIFEECVNKDFLKARKKLLDIILTYGLSGVDIIAQLQKEVWKNTDLTNQQKLGFVKACGEAEFRLIEGSDEYIQLEALLATLIASLE
jgi:replication factor C small subunit